MKKISAHACSVLSVAGLLVLAALMLAVNNSAVVVLLGFAALALCATYLLSMAKTFASDPYIYFNEVDLSRREVAMA